MKVDFNQYNQTDNVKGQAAIEYMIVIGIALIVAVPFVVKAQTSVVDIRSSVSLIQTQNTLNNIDVAVRTVNAAGSPSARTIEADLPDNINRTTVRENSISFVLNTQSGIRTVSRTFETNLTGNIPDQPGLYLLRIKAVEGGDVNIQVVS